MGFWARLFGKRARPAARAAASRPRSPSVPQSVPEELLAAPISRDRMDLLWMDPPALGILKITAGSSHGTVMVDDDQAGVRELQVTPEDIAWAEQVNVVAEQALAAGQQGRYQEAIRLYREALRLAPGCDLYLMSIGCCYANMGQPRAGLPYLERAAQISPANARIQRNLAGVRQAL